MRRVKRAISRLLKPQSILQHLTTLVAVFIVASGCRTTAKGSESTELNNSLRDELALAAMPVSRLEATPRTLHTSIWTGEAMMVWGGIVDTKIESAESAGGIFYPETNHWYRIQRTERGSRYYHTSVWGGDMMIAWGGVNAATRDTVATGFRISPQEDVWREVTVKDAPSARSGHSAVWTGNEMLVWGGASSDSNYLADGGTYDPVEDVWKKVNAEGAPIPRAYHTAIWTGDKMLVWGGGDQDKWLSSGGVYAPDTKTWTPTAETGAPTPRISHTAVWTGEKMIVWGGRSGEDQLLSDGAIFDPTANTWEPLPKAPAALRSRELHTAIWTGEEMVIWGGRHEQKILGDGAAYNPKTGTWRLIKGKGKVSARCEHTAVWTGKEMLIFGGKGPGNKLITNTNHLGFRLPIQVSPDVQKKIQKPEEHLVNADLE